MPNKNSAKKALRQTKKLTILNNQRKNAFKKAIKNTLKAEKKEDKTILIQKTQKALDKAAKKGVIKKKTASRKLSRLIKQVGK